MRRACARLSRAALRDAAAAAALPPQPPPLGAPRLARRHMSIMDKLKGAIGARARAQPRRSQRSR
jgi:hypothetical protein